jgi:hypothetical protein
MMAFLVAFPVAFPAAFPVGSEKAVPQKMSKTKNTTRFWISTKKHLQKK